MNDQQKWMLIAGCHKGTLMSRDSGADEFDTREDAVAAFAQMKRVWESIGYQVWFATLRSPEGKEEVLDHGTPYR